MTGEIQVLLLSENFSDELDRFELQHSGVNSKMPVVDVFGRGASLDCARSDSTFLLELTGEELSDEEWPIDGDHISLRFIEVDGRQIGDIELVISAHSFAGRATRKDQIYSRIRTCLEERWNVQVRCGRNYSIWGMD